MLAMGPLEVYKVLLLPIDRINRHEKFISIKAKTPFLAYLQLFASCTFQDSKSEKIRT